MQVVRPPSADGGTDSPQQQRQASDVAARLCLAALAASLAMCAPPAADAFPAAAAAAPSRVAGFSAPGFSLAAAGNPAVLRGIERMESGNLAAEDGTPAPTTQQRETNKLQVGTCGAWPLRP